MNRVFGKEIMEAAPSDPMKCVKLTQEAVEYYSNTMIGSIQPINTVDIPFIYASLLLAQESLKKLDAKGAELGKELFDTARNDVMAMVVPATD